MNSMNQSTLNKLHIVQVELLNEIFRVCNKYNIKPFLVYGTLLGAVRHKGFIPWDDDIGMTTDDYIKFLEVAPKELSNDYFIDDSKYNKDYYLWFAKVKKKDTVFIEEETKDVKNLKRNIFIDIFPFINFENKGFKYKYNFKKFYFIQMMICSKIDVYKTLFGRFLKIISLPFSINTLVKKQHKIVFKCNNINSKYISCFGVKNLNGIFERKDLFPLSKIEFEGNTYYGFKNNGIYLKTMYGDYMKLPPKEKRFAHKPIDIKFNAKKDN